MVDLVAPVSYTHLYIQTKKQPAFRIKVPAQSGNGRGVEEDKKAVYEEIHLLPLEYIFSRCV